MENIKKETRGRKEYVATKENRQQVGIWAACGMQQDFMCSQLINPATGKGISRHTLEKVYRSELDNGLLIANSIVQQSLFKKAVGNAPQNVTAAIFWLKCRAGWKPVEGLELTGKDGLPIASVPEMSNEQINKVAARMHELGKSLDDSY